MKPTWIKLTGVLLGILFAGIHVALAQDRDLQYVTDKLRLSLYSQADQSSNVIKLLQSGDSLEVEQIQGPYAFVVTEDGTRGWVKRGFLVEDPTSNILLDKALDEIDALEAEIDKLTNSKVVIDQYEADMDQMVVKIETLEQEKAVALDELEQFYRQQAEAEAEDLAAQTDTDGLVPDSSESETTLSSSALVAAAGVDLREIGSFALVHWKLIVPLLAILILIVFLVSKVIIETRIKSRFHGIKIW